MSVIVHDDMPIDQALKMLWREANRENIPVELLKNRYRVKPASARHEFKKYWEKTKRRRKSAKRRRIRAGK
ncbi:MAG: bS21 family ribosomal protein [Candidatus Dojkabacteria bacterium]